MPTIDLASSASMELAVSLNCSGLRLSLGLFIHLTPLALGIADYTRLNVFD